MATQAERKALVFLAAIAALGVAARGVRAGRDRRVEAAGVTALARQIAAVDSASAAVAARRRAAQAPGRSAARQRAAGAGEDRRRRAVGDAAPPGGASGRRAPAVPASPVDLDVAGAEEIATIPGIGPVLAARIVEDRGRRGAFGSLAGVQRVKGIGPALAGRIDRYVRFSRPLAAPPVVIEFPKARRRPKSP